MDKLRAALEQLDEALDRLEDAVAALPDLSAEALAKADAPQTGTKTDTERAEIARRLDQVIVDVQGFLDLGIAA